MDELEKVEKLRARANVSYEEAKQALAAANGDLLDAMVLLEKQGKAKAPENTTYSTGYEAQRQYLDVKETVKEQEARKRRTFMNSFADLCRTLVRKAMDTSFVVSRHGVELLRIPVWVLIVAIFFWEITLIALLVALFFDCRYSFVSKSGNLDPINKMMDQASDAAGKRCRRKC